MFCNIIPERVCEQSALETTAPSQHCSKQELSILNACLLAFLKLPHYETFDLSSPKDRPHRPDLQASHLPDPTLTWQGLTSEWYPKVDCASDRKSTQQHSKSIKEVNEYLLHDEGRQVEVDIDLHQLAVEVLQLLLQFRK